MNLTPNTNYTYRVAAVDAAGNTSTQSAPVTVRTLPISPIEPPPDTTVPSTPTWGTATAVSSTRINLAWNASTDNVGVQGYRVYRNGSLVGILPVGFVSFSDTGLQPASSYTYSLEAVDGAGNVSARSADRSTTTNP